MLMVTAVLDGFGLTYIPMQLDLASYDPFCCSG